MVWETVRFLAVSNIETFAVFSLMLSIFRLKPLKFFWPAMFTFLMFNLLSYFMREELSLYYLVPAISIIIYILLITTVVRVPIIWASIAAITGMFIYTLLQSIIIFGLFGNFSEDMQFTTKGSIVQLISSLWTYFISWLLLKFKIGFDAQFERLKFKWEHILVITFIMIALSAAAVLMYYNNMLYVMLFLAIVSAMFLYYSLKKERENLRKEEEEE